MMESLFNALKDKDSKKMENCLNAIRTQISPQEIQDEDKGLLLKARDFLQKVKASTL